MRFAYLHFSDEYYRITLISFFFISSSHFVAHFDGINMVSPFQVCCSGQKSGMNSLMPNFITSCIRWLREGNAFSRLCLFTEGAREEKAPCFIASSDTTPPRPLWSAGPGSSGIPRLTPGSTTSSDRDPYGIRSPVPIHHGIMEFSLNGAELSVNSGNSENLRNHWSMNWVQHKDLLCYLWLCGLVVSFLSLTQEILGSSPTLLIF